MAKYPRSIPPLNLSTREKSHRLKRLLKLANFNKENYEQEVKYYEQRGCFDDRDETPMAPAVDPRASEEPEYINHIRERRIARRRQEDR
ncbi:MAG: hypothetical protein DRQ98_10130 [Gammaproteobacteria bacterium]|nr:MAG: hypothetical protein DRQ98_10130 [Gammaproteobacteria bacterium]